MSTVPVFVGTIVSAVTADNTSGCAHVVSLPVPQVEFGHVLKSGVNSDAPGLLFTGGGRVFVADSWSENNVFKGGGSRKAASNPRVVKAHDT